MNLNYPSRCKYPSSWPVAVVALIFLGCQKTDYSELTPGTNLFVEGPVIELGTVRQGETARSEFTLINPLQVPIRINQIRPSCTCTIPEVVTPLILKPGQRETVAVAVDTENKSGVTKNMLMVVAERSETPSNPQYRTEQVFPLQVLCNVRPEFWITTEELQFGLIDKSRAWTKRFAVHKSNPESYPVGVNSSHQQFDITYEPDLSDDTQDTYRVAYQPREDRPSESIRGEFSMRYENSKRVVVKAKFSGRLDNPLDRTLK